MRHWSIGDICKSAVWISLEMRPLAWWRWHLSFGRTYNGTIGGLLIMTPVCSVLGHIRNTRLTAEQLAKGD